MTDATPGVLTRQKNAETRRENALAAKLTAELYAKHMGGAAALAPKNGAIRFLGSVTPPGRNLDPLPHDYR